MSAGYRFSLGSVARCDEFGHACAASFSVCQEVEGWWQRNGHHIRPSNLYSLTPCSFHSLLSCKDTLANPSIGLCAERLAVEESEPPVTQLPARASGSGRCRGVNAGCLRVPQLDVRIKAKCRIVREGTVYHVSCDYSDSYLCFQYNMTNLTHTSIRFSSTVFAFISKMYQDCRSIHHHAIPLHAA